MRTRKKLEKVIVDTAKVGSLGMTLEYAKEV